MSIRLSEQHGVNPCIPKCFWCGEDKNEIVLLGKLPNDAEAPRNMVFDYEPCDKCKESFSKGVHFIVASHKPFTSGQPAFSKDADGKITYVNGQHLVITEEAVRRIISNTELAESIIKMKKTFIDEETFKMLTSEL